MSKKQLICRAYNEMRGKILAIFRQAGISEADSEDMLHDVFERLMGMDVLMEETVNGIVAVMAYRKRIDYLRRRTFMQRLYSSANNAEMMERGACYSDPFEWQEVAQAERRAIAKLPQENQRIYRMSRYDELDCNEIARQMGMTYRAVESRLYRARQHVRDEVRRFAV